MTYPNDQQLSKQIKEEAMHLGFDHCGIAPVEIPGSDLVYFKTWLEKQQHGTMKYLERSPEVRANPALTLPGAKSVICVLLNYFPNLIHESSDCRIAKYAYGNDYHRVVGDKLDKLVKCIGELAPGSRNIASVDSSPAFEKRLAQMAGLGWIGKNTLLINTDSGSWSFIGLVITDLRLDHDQPSTDGCKDCRVCVDACPTGALTEARCLDARKCISYLTNSYKEDFDADTPEDFKNYIYGCDICQDVCPKNHNVHPHDEEELSPRSEILDLRIRDWERLSDEEFMVLTHDSCMQQKGLKKMLKNILHVKLAGMGEK